jgi:hypothetical protein
MICLLALILSSSITVSMQARAVRSSYYNAQSVQTQMGSSEK